MISVLNRSSSSPPGMLQIDCIICAQKVMATLNASRPLVRRVNIKESKHLMKFLNKKFVLGVLVLGVLGYGVHLSCEFTGNNHEPQRGRAVQESIGKLCDISGLKRFGAPPQSGDSYPLDIDDLIDGTKPARHSTLIKTFSSREEIQRHYEAACQREGYTLAPPSPADYDVACSKKDGEYKKELVGRVKCDGAMCDIGLALETSPYY